MTASQPRYRAGAAPINWGVYQLEADNPDPGGMLDAMAAAGYEGSELGPLGYLISEPDDLATVFAPRNLALVSAFVGVDLAKPLTEAFLDEFDAIAALLMTGGAGAILISDGMSDDRAAVAGRVETHPETWWSDDDWHQVLINLAALDERSRAHGLHLAYHPHAGTHVESGREILRLLDATAKTGLRLCLDTGHILIGEIDPVAVLEQAGSRVVHVHAKDVDGAVLARMRGGEISYFAAVAQGLYCDLGDGEVDWDGIKHGLHQAGYTGWIVVEQDCQLRPGDSRPIVSLERNRGFVRRHFGA